MINYSINSKYIRLIKDELLSLAPDISRKFWSEFYYLTNLSEELIIEFEDQVSWSLISYYCTLSEGFMEKFHNRLDWVGIFSCQKYSIDFVLKFQHKIPTIKRMKSLPNYIDSNRVLDDDVKSFILNLEIFKQKNDSQ